jgi:hypothetical protein
MMVVGCCFGFAVDCYIAMKERENRKQYSKIAFSSFEVLNYLLTALNL